MIIILGNTTRKIRRKTEEVIIILLIIYIFFVFLVILVYSRYIYLKEVRKCNTIQYNINTKYQMILIGFI